MTVASINIWDNTDILDENICGITGAFIMTWNARHDKKSKFTSAVLLVQLLECIYAPPILMLLWLDDNTYLGTDGSQVHMQPYEMCCSEIHLSGIETSKLPSL